jgi:hypothetical protein
MLGASLPNDAHAQSEVENRTGRIRAALVYYIVKFVDLSSLPGDSITVCILGDDSMNSFIDATITGKKAHGKTLLLKKFTTFSASDMNTQCSVRFIGKTETPYSSYLPELASQKQAITICATDKPHFNGCFIEMFEQDNKIRLAIDLSLIDQANMKVSSELLEVAVLKK